MANIVSYTKAKIDQLIGTKADTTAVGALSAASAEVKAGYTSRWQANMPYTIGFPVMNPSGQIVTALTNHTSGATYDASKWSGAGVATLDANGKILTSQLPTLAINDTFVVASQAAMLALTAQRGDMARRTDTTPAKLFVLAADDATNINSWIEITASGAVTSVDGQAGTVSLGAVTATNDSLARRSSTGTLTAATAVASTELTTKGQMDTADNLRELKADADTHRTRTTALESPPFFAGYLTGVFNVPASTWTEVPITGELVDTGNAHALNAARFIAPRAGYYRVAGQCAFASVGTAGAVVRASQFVTNGRDRIGSDGFGAGIGPVFGSANVLHYASVGVQLCTPCATRRIYLAQGEWVSLYAFANAATTLPALATADPGQTTFLEVTWDGI